MGWMKPGETKKKKAHCDARTSRTKGVRHFSDCRCTLAGEHSGKHKCALCGRRFR